MPEINEVFLLFILLFHFYFLIHFIIYLECLEFIYKCL